MPRVLPERFELAHDLSFILHDHIAQHVKEGESRNLLSFNVSLSTREAEEVKDLSGTELWHWFEVNGRQDVLEKHSYRNLVFGLTSDLCHFIYEGLKCAEKGKLSVAFSNLRKPLQDNLLYLEWILADWPTFLDKFRQSADHLDFSKLQKEIRKTRRIEIIGHALDKTSMERWIRPKWLYELRYEKASDIGLDPLFNHALHLVTTFKHYATEPENMNFIFCNDDDRERLWHHLYLLLPPILLHALYVTRALFRTLDADFDLRDTFTDLWLAAGLMLWAERTCGDEFIDKLSTTFGEFFNNIPLDCPSCAHKLKLESENLLSLWEYGTVRCMVCDAKLQLLETSHVAYDDF